VDEVRAAPALAGGRGEKLRAERNARGFGFALLSWCHDRQPDAPVENMLAAHLPHHRDASPGECREVRPDRPPPDILSGRAARV
jgi:hypothetical protein